MTNSVSVFPPGFRLLDANGDPISGGTFSFFLAGTSTPMTVYSDQGLSSALGTEVETDSGGYPSSSGNKAAVYVGLQSYKVIITDADDVTIATHDNVKGAIAAETLAWQGSWANEIFYGAQDAVNNDRAAYIATVAHTSSAATEPGVGEDWEDVWRKCWNATR